VSELPLVFCWGAIHSNAAASGPLAVAGVFDAVDAVDAVDAELPEVALPELLAL
jgi:hypothetical protein